MDPETGPFRRSPAREPKDLFAGRPTGRDYAQTMSVGETEMPSTTDERSSEVDSGPSVPNSGEPYIQSLAFSRGFAGHFERIGGLIISPRSTLSRLLRPDCEEGRIWSILVWLVFLCLILDPSQTGRIVLIARIDVPAGVMLLANMFGRYVWGPFMAIILSTIVLSFASRFFRRPLSVDRALDVSAYFFVPYIALTVLGVLLLNLGIDVTWLPHHRWDGVGVLAVVQTLFRGGPFLVLLGLAVQVLRRPDDGSTQVGESFVESSDTAVKAPWETGA